MAALIQQMHTFCAGFTAAPESFFLGGLLGMLDGIADAFFVFFGLGGIAETYLEPTVVVLFASFAGLTVFRASFVLLAGAFGFGVGGGFVEMV